ncbi:uncharacterized protein BDZ99DRAFT_527097 [Mytilinidion resinicola]|uniref:Myb-like domain-containing protein n=1 Tax=Mytilinidion resinicola TaxID=574789 RepID=A0A6A6Y3A6_9PEZI|nr:uncharacterized protein BDZ99DRAFT_527097 [Mytilinidion resinicola]KAF2803008.1 hypothetical protein BDZ99DRAFT_527097 [Mytilinidion resinicola]
MSTSGREPTPADGVPSSDLRKRARSLCSSSVGSGTDEDGISDDGHRRLRDNGYGSDGSSGDDNDDEDDDDGYGDHGGKSSATGRRNRRWEREEERRLLAWRRDGKPLAWIADRLDRTEGAVYLRWHTLQRSAQGEAD